MIINNKDCFQVVYLKAVLLFFTIYNIMRLSLFFIFFYLFDYSVCSQNLVPNPSFEKLSNCPDMLPNYFYIAYPWNSATQFSGSILHGCSDNTDIAPPNAPSPGISFQYPRTGLGMCLFLGFRNASPLVCHYLQTPLISSLEKGKNYYIRFFVSPNKAKNDVNPNYSDAIGLALTEKEIHENLSYPKVLNLEPAIERRGQVIIDTAGWTKISGFYMAKGNEMNAIIGNFRGIEGTIVYHPDKETFPEGSEYYLDDVLIEAFDPMPDTMMLCMGEEIKFNASFYEATYKWNTGAEDSTITINKPGRYTVDAYLDGYIFSDTTVVVEEPKWTSMVEDTTLCYGETLLIEAPTYGIYKWSTGSENSFIEVKEKGIYSLKIENECGQFDYQMNVDTINCDCNVLVPNIFTPDGDFINDQISVKFDCDFAYKIVDFWIFDRWGEEIYYETGDNTILWNGTFKNEKVTPGVYVWVLRLELSRNNKVENKMFSGDITILR